MKIGTQDQSFFPEDMREKFIYLKDKGFDCFEIDGKILVDHIEEVKQAIDESGVPVITACGGYDGWIGDFDDARREQGLQDISRILEALEEINGNGIIVPAAWGMFTYRLPPMASPRSVVEDHEVLSQSLSYLDKKAMATNTIVYLEPLNRYQDHMINTVEDAKQLIESNNLKNIKILADFYHMNIEEDNITDTLRTHEDLIQHIHLADNHRHQPGSGSINFPQHFRQLKNAKYQGYLTIECRVRGSQPETEYLRSLQYLKSL